MEEIQFHFEWDEAKAATNLQKHGISFDLARTIFDDPNLLTVADLAHSENEERWFSIGTSSGGAVVSVAYLWTKSSASIVRIRLISARRATQAEMSQYGGSL